MDGALALSLRAHTHAGRSVAAAAAAAAAEAAAAAAEAPCVHLPRDAKLRDTRMLMLISCGGGVETHVRLLQGVINNIITLLIRAQLCFVGYR